MIHFVPDSLDAVPVEATPYSEAVSRLASLRQALDLLDGTISDPADSAPVAHAWAKASDVRREQFDDRSARTVAGSVAGIEAISELRSNGGGAHPAALGHLSNDIRTRLDELGGLFSL